MCGCSMKSRTRVASLRKRVSSARFGSTILQKAAVFGGGILGSKAVMSNWERYTRGGFRTNTPPFFRLGHIDCGATHIYGTAAGAERATALHDGHGVTVTGQPIGKSTTCDSRP